MAEKDQGSKVTRGLHIHVEPIAPGNYGVAFKDRTTRSDGSERLTEERATADSGSRDAVLQKIGLQLSSFAKTLTTEAPGELFEVKKRKPRRDPKS